VRSTATCILVIEDRPRAISVITRVSNTNKIDITPEDSVVPVYLEPWSEQQLEIINHRDPEEEAKDQKAALVEQKKEDSRQSALAKLAKLGLTEDEARAVIGL